MLSKALGLMVVSSGVRGLSALVPVILASVVGAGAIMDRYMAFLTVISVVCALSAAPFANIVSREVAAAGAKKSTGALAPVSPSKKRKTAPQGDDAAYGKAARRSRRWAQKIGSLSFWGYLPLSGLAALALANQSSAPLKLWALLLIGAPCVYVSARIAVEQALLQARGHPYLALSCSAIFSAACLIGALSQFVPGLKAGGIYFCAAAVSVGAVLELYVTRKYVTLRQEQRIAGTGPATPDPEAQTKETRDSAPSPPDCTQAVQRTSPQVASINMALESEPADLTMGALPSPLGTAPLASKASRKESFPWQDFLILTGASAGALLSGFFDQWLMSRMGTGVQASFGLASRIPSFLTLSIFAAGSILAAMLLAKKNSLTTRQLHTRVLELFGLMLGLSVGLVLLLWWQALPLIKLIYEHGVFAHEESLIVAKTLPFAALAYMLYPASAVLMRCAAVQAGTRILLMSSGTFIAIKVTFGAVGFTQWGLGAIAASSVVAYVAQCAVLWRAMLVHARTEKKK